jgi:hypothetical protein
VATSDGLELGSTRTLAVAMARMTFLSQCVGLLASALTGCGGGCGGKRGDWSSSVLAVGGVGPHRCDEVAGGFGLVELWRPALGGEVGWVKDEQEEEVSFGCTWRCSPDAGTPGDGSWPTTFVIPRSKKEGTKPPYVCPGCSNHTYGNNMITRFHVQ